MFVPKLDLASCCYRYGGYSNLQINQHKEARESCREQRSIWIPTEKSCSAKNDPNTPSHDASPKTSIDNASHFSPSSKGNIMTSDSERIPLLPWIQLLIPMPLLHLDPSHQKYPQLPPFLCIHWIVSGMMIMLKNLKMNLVRYEWNVCAAIMPLGW